MMIYNLIQNWEKRAGAMQSLQPGGDPIYWATSDGVLHRVGRSERGSISVRVKKTAAQMQAEMHAGDIELIDEHGRRLNFDDFAWDDKGDER